MESSLPYIEIVPCDEDRDATSEDRDATNEDRDATNEDRDATNEAASKGRDSIQLMSTPKNPYELVTHNFVIDKNGVW